MSSSPPLRKKRSVSFDEELNEVREFDPVPTEDKAKVWLSRVQIKLNRFQVQEELMMEKTRELVKAKLVEEATLPTDQAELVREVKRLQQQLEEIMSRPKSEILAFLRTKFNWITDCTDYWKDLPEKIQEAASQLGYRQELWDDFSQQLEVFDKPWNALTIEQQAAAQIIGYNEVTWNGSLETDSTVMTLAEDEPRATVVEMEEGEDAANPTDSSGTGSSTIASPLGDDDDEASSSSSSSSNSSSNEEGETLAKDMTNDVENGIISEYDWSDGGDPRIDVKADTMDEEDEFIANFLLDDTAKSNGNENSSSSLQDRYVPSDDEFDLDLDQDDPITPQIGDDQGETKTIDFRNAKDNVTSSLATVTFPSQDKNQVVIPNEETSPLLGHKASSVKERGLFRRILGSSVDPRNELSCASSVKQGNDEDDDDDDDYHQKPNHPTFTKTQKRIGIALLGLTVLWLFKYHKTTPVR